MNANTDPTRPADATSVPVQESESIGRLLVTCRDQMGLVAAMSELSGLDLHRLGTTADADEIKDTAVTQPLVVSLALLAAFVVVTLVGM